MFKVKLGTQYVRVKFFHAVPHYTVCIIYPAKWTRHTLGDAVYGFALCHENDQFSRKTGRKIAMTRALTSMPKWMRKLVWEGYFKAQGGYS